MREDTIIIKGHPKNREQIKIILNALSKTREAITLYDDEHNAFLIPIITIYYFECIDRKVYAYTKNGIYRLYELFSDLKTKYEALGIYQINKTTLLNIHHIQSYKITADCRRLVILDNNEKLIINRRYQNVLKNISAPALLKLRKK